MILLERRYWRYALYRGYLNLTSEASKYRLGWLWWFFEPVAMTGVFYFVFAFLRSRGPDFVYFLLVGVTSWLWFSNSVGNATQSVAAGKSLILQLKLPKPIFPIISVATSSYKQLFVFFLLLLIIGSSVGITSSWIWFPALVLTQLTLISACAMAASFACAWLPDVRFLIVSGLQLMMFCSGIFFDLSTFPEASQSWFRLNPMAVLLEQYRLVLLYGQAPDHVWCLAVIVIASACTLALERAFAHWDYDLTLRIAS